MDSSNQAIIWSWDSIAFGVGAPVASVTFNLRFPGHYYDVGTGQFYNHNRFYNRELGRYMEPDPIGLEGGLNPFVYAGNNPVMNSDPSGLILHWLSDMHLSMMAGINNSLNNYVDPKHFEIISTLGTFLTPEHDMNLCSKIKCVR